MSELDLAPRLREIAILRVGHRYNSTYEWHHHCNIGRSVGLSDEEIEAIQAGPGDPIWSDLEASILRAVDEIIDHAETSDATWAVLLEHLGPKQLMELIYTIGTYGVSVVWNTPCAATAERVDCRPSLKERRAWIRLLQIYTLERPVIRPVV